MYIKLTPSASIWMDQYVSIPSRELCLISLKDRMATNKRKVWYLNLSSSITIESPDLTKFKNVMDIAKDIGEKKFPEIKLCLGGIGLFFRDEEDPEYKKILKKIENYIYSESEGLALIARKLEEIREILKESQKKI